MITLKCLVPHLRWDPNSYEIDFWCINCGWADKETIGNLESYRNSTHGPLIIQYTEFPEEESYNEYHKLHL